MDPVENTSPANSSKNNTPKPAVKKSPWFTPCRQLGLKRKSPSVCTPKLNTSSSVNSALNSSFKSHRLTFQTPVKATDSLEAKGIKSEVGVLRPSPIHATTATTAMWSHEKDNLRSASRIDLGQVKCSKPTLCKTPNKSTKIVSVPEHCSATDRRITHTPIQSTSTSEELGLDLEDPSEEDVELLRKRIQEKEEQLNALKSSQIYKTKKETEKLSKLTKKWLQGCQEALTQLFEKTKSLGYQYTMMELLVQLHIPNALVQYDPDLDEFT